MEEMKQIHLSTAMVLATKYPGIPFFLVFKTKGVGQPAGGFLP